MDVRAHVLYSTASVHALLRSARRRRAMRSLAHEREPRGRQPARLLRVDARFGLAVRVARRRPRLRAHELEAGCAHNVM